MMSIAYHTREHGFSARPAYVLGQGTPSVDLGGSSERLDVFRTAGGMGSAGRRG